MRRLLLCCIGILLLVAACQKYDSIIKGQVTIKDAQENISPAVNAHVEKYQLLHDDTTKMSIVMCDSAGNYQLNYVTKGDWIIKAYLYVDTLKYEAVSNVVTTKGEDEEIIVDLMLEYQEDESGTIRE